MPVIVLLSEASSSSHVEFNIARQRGPLGSEPAILLDLTASEHEICHIDIMHDTLVQPNLSHMDFLDDPAAIQGCTLILSCTTNNASSNEHMHPEILMKNHHWRTYSFTWYLKPAVNRQPLFPRGGPEERAALQ